VSGCLRFDDFLIVVLFIYFNCDFFFSVKVMYNHFNHRSGKKAPLIADDVYEIIIKVVSMSNCLRFEMGF